MPYTIYNDATASFPDQAEPDQVDFNILGGVSGTVSGCGVTANGTNLNLTVASGQAIVNGTPVTCAGGTAVIGVASANPRWDLVYLTSGAAITVLAGTPTATNAQIPSFDPANGVALVAVYIPTSTSALTSGHLVDKRKQISADMERIATATTDSFLVAKVTGDTTNRVKMTADGKVVWTPGNSASPAPALGFDATLAGLLLTGKLGATASAATETPLTVTGAGGQSVDLLQVRSSTPTVLVKVDSTGNLTAPNWKRGSGAPNGSVVGSVGDVYQQTDGANGATLWIKESGNATNSGWNASGTTSAGLVLGGGQIATGCIMEYPAGALPGGFLWCDGSAVSRSTFSALFALWGTTFGSGDGSTTFNVIDKRGIITAGSQNFGAGSTIGVGDRQIGTTIGATVGTRNTALSTTELPSHNHPGSTDLGHVHLANKRNNLGTTPYAPTGFDGTHEVEYIQSAAGFGNVGGGNANISVAFQGSGGQFSILQPTQLSRYIVKF